MKAEIPVKIQIRNLLITIGAGVGFAFIFAVFMLGKYDQNRDQVVKERNVRRVELHAKQVTDH